MITHELKCWPEFFQAVSRNDKTFEIRKNDRDFKVGDRFKLREFCPDKNAPTGNVSGEFEVTYILDLSRFGCSEDMVALGMRRLSTGWGEYPCPIDELLQRDFEATK